DGTPLTSADVAFSYSLPQTVDGLPFAGITRYVASVEAVDDLTVKFVTEGAEVSNPGMVQVYLQNVPIMPKHIWEPLMESDEPITYVVDLEPVGSGPYMIDNANAQQISLIRNDDYWGNEI